MLGFLVGAVAGGLAVWMWRDRLTQVLGDATETARSRAVEGLERVQQTAEGVIDTAKERLQGYGRSEESERSGSPHTYR